ncbi:MAG TPA: uroporphyrinogen-III synthase [Thermoplasmata archaeon]|nr:uroporphyrinogen-III synthase [Thermoplasmata archaeon]
MAVRGLEGRTVLVAGSAPLVARLTRALRDQGATVVPCPTVRLAPPSDPSALDAAIRRWSSNDWVVFTSARAVDAIVDRARALQVDLSRFHGKIAAVGPATRARLEAARLPVHAMPDEFLTDAIPDAVGDVCGMQILLPRSRLARKSLAEELRGRGANVTEVEAYDALPASPDLDAIRATPRFDFVVLTSASAARNLVALLTNDLQDRVRTEAEAVCIGPVTADEAHRLGFRVTIVAREHTVRGLVESLARVEAHG